MFSPRQLHFLSCLKYSDKSVVYYTMLQAFMGSFPGTDCALPLGP